MPAAVEEKDRLLATFEPGADAIGQLARKDMLALRVEHLASHVHDAEGRHRAVIDALSHHVQGVAAGRSVLPSLQ